MFRRGIVENKTPRAHINAMLTGIQKKTAQAIVNIFETGKALGDYGSVTVLKGDAGHLTYGRSQTTLASGNLALLIRAYCEAKGRYTGDLKPFLPAFDRRDIKLDTNEKVKGILKSAGDDPVMQKVQDGFFDRVYWEPAQRSADDLGITMPLGVCVVYDSKIHGSFDRIKNMTVDSHGTVDAIGETPWITAYVTTRRDWLANHRLKILHKTVYRMDAFIELILKDKWELPLPLTVRHVEISEDIFTPTHQPPVVASAEEKNQRVLCLARPMMRGQDVKRLQQLLGFKGKQADGIFGKGTDKAVRAFQKKQGLKVDGKVGPATWGRLENV